MSTSTAVPTVRCRDERPGPPPSAHAVPASLLDRRAGWCEPVLDADSERRLARSIEAGLLAREALDTGVLPAGASIDDLEALAAEGQRAWERFHASNIGLVVKLVHDAEGRLDDDLMQQGLEALGQAIRMYDADRGFRFSTLAHQYVQRAVTLARRRRDSLLSVPDGRLGHLAQVAAVRAELAERGEPETVAAVAERLGRSEAWVGAHWTRDQRVVADVVEAEAIGVPVAPIGTATVSSPVEGGDGGELPMWWLAHLPADEARILRLRFGLDGTRPLTCARIAALDQVSVASVRGVEQRGLAHVRDLVLHGEYEGGGLTAEVDGFGVLVAC